MKTEYDRWQWDEQNGWYNDEDDPASGIESELLDEIASLRSKLDHLVAALIRLGIR